MRPFGPEVILELKFANRFPDWFRLLVRHFGLMQCGAAKYCEGIDALGETRLNAPLRRGPVHSSTDASRTRTTKDRSLGATVEA